MEQSSQYNYRDPFLEGEESQFNATEILWKYLSWLPLFIGSLAVCLITAFLFIRYAEPVYKISTRVLVKTDKDNPLGGSTGGSSSDLIESALFGGGKVNLDNEVVMISARPLLQRVVEKHKFNDACFEVGTIRRSEVWPAPISVKTEPAGDSTETFGFYLRKLTAKGGEIEFNGESGTGKPMSFIWGLPLQNGGKTWTILPVPGAELLKDETVYYFRREAPGTTAGLLLEKLTAKPFSKQTTIIQLELNHPSRKKAAAMLDALAAEYNNQNVGDKTTVLNHTIDFINTRLNYITQELGDVENSLRDFKDNNRLINIEAQSSNVLDRQSTLEDELIKIGVEEELFRMVYKEVRQMKPEDLRTIPGINAPGETGSNTVIEAYNTLLLRKKREEPVMGANSPALRDINAQLKAALQAVIQYFEEHERGLSLRKKALEQQRRQFEGLVSGVPAKEKTLVEIKRQQNVKEGLYLYLLQKREESAIASAGTTSNYNQVEPAGGPSKPVSPNTLQVYGLAVLLGLLFPVGLIFLMDLFDDKIRNREDISAKTKMPVTAEIGHVANMQSNLVVADKSRNLVAEQFRVLRTNIDFMLKGGKTLLVTSTLSGEGKSFAALNLAAVLAISGKKVALLEFDLRRPRIVRNTTGDKRNNGLSNYLAGQTEALGELHYKMDNYPTLDIYPCGPVPPNPAELMIGERMEKLFATLTTGYDFVVVDSAPVGLVSDAFSLLRYADVCLYVIRQRATRKKQLLFVDELYKSGKLKSAGLILNDVKLGARHGYYGYHYGYGYGYTGYGGYGYGTYGKGYGEYFDVEKKAWSLPSIFKRKN